MIELLLFVAAAVWLARQFRPAGARRWAARLAWAERHLAPVRKHIADDVRQVRNDLRVWSTTRKMKSKGWHL